MSASFDASALDRPYGFLDSCPDELMDAVITLPERLGKLDQRAGGVRLWFDALMDGRLPADRSWPPDAIGRSFRATLERLAIARFCKGQRDLVVALMTDMLRSCDRQAAQLSSSVDNLIRELLKLQSPERKLEGRIRGKRVVPLDLVGSGSGLGLGLGSGEPSSDIAAVASSDLQALKRRAEQMAQAEVPPHDELVLEVWAERVRDWRALSEVFGELGDMLTGRGWSLTRGVLKHLGWREMLRLREIIEKLPQLREIVQSLGRLHLEVDDEDSIVQQVFTPLRRADFEWRERPDPRVPADLRGIVRSGDIARMLPLEAVMLGHPALKMLWHARRAERALLAYRVEGTELVREVIEGEGAVASESPAPKPIRGPIIAIVDTSGSMSGLPETVAKALVLEALRTAHAEQRECLLFAFGSHGEVLEHRLSLDQGGVAQLLSFLTFSFGGGTDTAGVLHQVLERLVDPTWAKADVLLVTDGDWRVGSETVGRVTAARDQGHRFHGVQVGFGDGLHSVCDPVHRFTDWRL